MKFSMHGVKSIKNLLGAKFVDKATVSDSELKDCVQNKNNDVYVENTEMPERKTLKQQKAHHEAIDNASNVVRIKRKS